MKLIKNFFYDAEDMPRMKRVYAACFSYALFTIFIFALSFFVK